MYRTLASKVSDPIENSPKESIIDKIWKDLISAFKIIIISTLGALVLFCTCIGIFAIVDVMIGYNYLMCKKNSITLIDVKPIKVIEPVKPTEHHLTIVWH